MAYIKTVWVNGTAPALNDTNLNKIEQGIFDSLSQDGSTAMTGQLVTIAGSAATPAIAPTGDANTGIFFPAADTIAFGEGGAEVMRITSAGNVGIGTTSPQAKLHVDVGATTGILSSYLARGYEPDFRLSTFNGTGTAINTEMASIGLSYQGNKVGMIGFLRGSSANAKAITFSTNNNDERMRIEQDGNVGIGTTNPLNLLHILKNQTSDTAIIVSNVGTSGATTTMSFVLQEAATPQGWFRRYRDGSSLTEIGFSNDLAFSSSITSTKAERMRITSAGNVGIGTTSPSDLLTLQAPSTTISGITIKDNGGNDAAQFAIIPSTGEVRIGGIRATGSYFPTIYSGNQERMRITTAGNVGIGTTAPSAALHVAGTTVNDLAIFESTDAGATAAPDVVLYRNSASPAANDILGSLVFRGKDAGGNTFNYAEIAGVITDPTNTIETGQLRFYTGTDGATTEKMRITATGNVGINQTNPTVGLDVSSLPATVGNLSHCMKITNTQAFQGFDFAGIAFAARTHTSEINTLAGMGGGKENDVLSELASNLRFYTRTNAAAIAEKARITSAGYLLIGYTASNGTYPLQVNGQIFATSSTIATSDGRYKKDVVALDGALDIVKALNPVQFSWKEHSVHKFNTDVPTVGFIAQEVQEVLKDKPYLTSLVKKSECTWETETGETIEREVTRDVEKQLEREIVTNVTDENGNWLRDEVSTITETVIEQVTEIVSEPVKETYTEEFLGIAESNLIAILTKAVQELTAKVEALEAQLNGN